MITVGSKSFSLAARLFGSETRDAAFFLYGWCRYCDDQVDQQDPGDGHEEPEKRLQALQTMTRSAFTEAPQRDPVFVALRYVAARYAIPEHYPLELLEGMAMDVRGERYRTFDDLLLYCYRVAGTVGLMMSHIMGVNDQSALRHAADLGIAMQLTNIARDVIEDADNGRIYLPLSWLEDAGIPPDEITLPRHRPKLAELAGRLLTEAERYYRSGDEGLRCLSFRSACAVTAARHVYSEIGTLVSKKGSGAWDDRCYVPTPRKLRVIAFGIFRALHSLPGRIGKPWSRAPITMVWRHSEVR
jgi:phytoene synthase